MGCSLEFLVFSLILLVLLSKGKSTEIPANFTVEYFDQKIDHFNYVNQATFKQRLLSSTDYWCDNGCPIFFYAGNEGDIYSFANNTGFMWENAPDFRAMVIFAEHRYYGESMPFGNESFSDLSKLGYLTVEQALADYAEIIQNLKRTIPAARKSPVIMFGGSYGGMLAAWFRMKYPHLVAGSLAASAPIFQFQGIYDCSKFYQQISDSFRSYSENCFQNIKKSWDAFSRVGSSEEGRNWISKTFKLCKPLAADEVKELEDWIIDTYGNLAMVDYPNPAEFLAPLPAYPINESCSYLRLPNDDDKTLLTNIFRAISVFYNYTGKADCNDITNSDVNLDAQGWGFQACTEMILPVCSKGENSMFPEIEWNLQDYQRDCFKTYKVMPDAYKAEWIFGGKNITTTSNIIFSNGGRDPWGPGGVQQVLSPSLKTIFIPHACHHEDLRWTGPNDPKTLLAARAQEISIIREWLNQYYTSIKQFPSELFLRYNFV